jgi:hypothetical protein
MNDDNPADNQTPYVKTDAFRSGILIIFINNDF